MNRCMGGTLLFIFLNFCFLFGSWVSWAEEPAVRITSPKDGSSIKQDKRLVIVTGKVSTKGMSIPKVDLILVIDVSSSTARYAGVDFPKADQPPGSSSGRGSRRQIGIFGGGLGGGKPIMMDLKNSVLVAEVNASRRLLSQLNSEMTRVGIVTFGNSAELLQPLTHDFDQVRRSLEEVLIAGPHGGTHMVGGIRLGIRELTGLAQSQRRKNTIKIQLLLTDGFPTLPIGGGKSAAPEDTKLAINAARIAGKIGIKIHVFALGKEALSYPRAAVGIAERSGGIFTPVIRPADIMTVLEKLSVIGVDTVEVFNQTTGKRATQLRLEADGFFSSALPVAEGRNRIQVLARTSGGAIGKDSISVFYQGAVKRSLDLEVFLEKGKSLKLEVDKLPEKSDVFQEEMDRSARDGLKRDQERPYESEPDYQP